MSTEPSKTSAANGVMPERARDTLAAAGAYALLTLILTWPVVRSLGHELPADLGDP